MFTGIIEEKQPIISITPASGKKIITIKANLVLESLKVGDSIASNGICLTVISFDNNAFSAEIMNETIRKTTAQFWKSGEIINLERALIYGNRLDGHLVQGHVDTIGFVNNIKSISNTIYYTISFDSSQRNLLIPQGSIAVNGVSLTVAELTQDTFTVALISHSSKLTNFETFVIGQRVNLEFDALGKYITNYAKTTDLESLLEKFKY